MSSRDPKAVQGGEAKFVVGCIEPTKGEGGRTFASVYQYVWPTTGLRCGPRDPHAAGVLKRFLRSQSSPREGLRIFTSEKVTRLELPSPL